MQHVKSTTRSLCFRCYGDDKQQIQCNLFKDRSFVLVYYVHPEWSDSYLVRYVDFEAWIKQSSAQMTDVYASDMCLLPEGEEEKEKEQNGITSTSSMPTCYSNPLPLDLWTAIQSIEETGEEKGKKADESMDRKDRQEDDDDPFLHTLDSDFFALLPDTMLQPD